MSCLKKYPSLLFIIFILGISLIYSCQPGSNIKTVRKSSETIRLKSTAFHGTPVDIVLLLDQSGSMNGTANTPATDPNQIRIHASRYLVNNLSRRDNTRMGYINFGTEAETVSGLISIADSKSRNALAEKITAKNLGYTNFYDALQESYKLFQNSGSFQDWNRSVILIFTDGSPADRRKLSDSEYFQEITKFVDQQLKPEGCELYIVGIDDTGNNWSRTQDKWQQIVGEDHLFTISAMDQLRRHFNEIVQRVFGLPITEPDVVTSEGMEFTVPPYLESIEFHVFPSKEGLELKIEKPDGTFASVDSSEVVMEKFEDYHIVTVQNPNAGTWQYHIVEGQGSIEVYRNPIPIQIHILEPSLKIPQGRQFRIRVMFRRDDGERVEEIPHFPLRLVARIQKQPQYEFQDYLLEKQEKGIYAASETVDADIEGKWKIEVVVQAGQVESGEDYKFSSTRMFEVVKQPYLSLNIPKSDTLPFGDGVFVETTVLLNRQPIDVSEYFVDSPLNLITAQIKQLPNGGDSPTVFLNPVEQGEKGRYRGYIPAELHQKGKALLTLRLAGTPNGADSLLEDVLTKTVYISMTPLQVWLWRGRLFIYIGAIVIGTLVLLFLIWYFMKPKMKFGSIAFMDEQSNELFRKDLSGYRLISIPTRKLAVRYAQESTMDQDSPLLEDTITSVRPSKQPKKIWVYSPQRGQSSDSDEFVAEKLYALIWKGFLPHSRKIERGESLPIGDGSFYIFYE